MILGRVTNSGVPQIKLPVGEQTWTAVVDTGFNGDLELPDAMRSLVKARFKGRFRSLLAGGQAILEDVYRVEFPFDGRIVVAEASFVSTNEILIGTHLLRHHVLEIDFPGKSIRLQRPSEAEQC